MKNCRQQHEQMRRKLWVQAYVAMLPVNSMSVKHWADRALEDFDKIFKPPIDESK